MNIERIIRENSGTIVDVRTREEFNGAGAGGSVNIPLQELDHRMNEIQELESPLVLCCASGNRSGIAQQVLAGKGIECFNAGSWMDVQYYQTQTV